MRLLLVALGRRRRDLVQAWKPRREKLRLPPVRRSVDDVHILLRLEFRRRLPLLEQGHADLGRPRRHQCGQGFPRPVEPSGELSEAGPSGAVRKHVPLHWRKRIDRSSERSLWCVCLDIQRHDLQRGRSHARHGSGTLGHSRQGRRRLSACARQDAACQHGSEIREPRLRVHRRRVLDGAVLVPRHNLRHVIGEGRRHLLFRHGNEGPRLRRMRNDLPCEPHGRTCDRQFSDVDAERQ